MATNLGARVSRSYKDGAEGRPYGILFCTHDERERFVEGIDQGDAEGAVKLMAPHLRELAEHLMLVSPGEKKSLAKLLGLG